MVEEVLDAQRPGCPPEYENIPIPSGHYLYNRGVKVMPFLRTRYDMTTGYSPNVPREQVRVTVRAAATLKTRSLTYLIYS